MTWRRKLALAFAAGLAALAAPPPTAARACATVSPRDAVGITREEAIVVWDAAAKEERFIRRAQFQTSEKDFGFLVPTPTKPDLAEASDAAFAALDQLVEDARETTTQSEWIPGCVFGLFARSKSAASIPVAAGVNVLDSKIVAGLDATVLEADSATALAAWLNAHGYVQRPEIVAWLQPYIDAKFKITAFKYADQENRPVVELLSKAVMLTFHTDRPYYPYREPADVAPTWGRLLRVFVIAPTKMDGWLGDQRAPWNAEPVYAGPLAGNDAKLAEQIPRALLPSGAWLTVMNDRAVKRSDVGELYFGAAKEAGEVKPPPRVVVRNVFVPIELGLVLAVVVIVVVRRVRRKKG